MSVKLDIQKTLDKAAAIKNFMDCYASCTLYGSVPNGDVRPESMLEWLVEHRYIIDIVDEYIKQK
ncbi:hypothetical protein WFC_00091 [Escherichia phage vB_EcoM_WFC]|uniref:Uncharacterized protein n=2 Tax=Wifcevirus TaxID=2733141 RepID=A0A9X9JUN7_9CAUD|nr:hypothetical protein HOV52_gp091 [Escherichia phage vB_EcoM_WFC]EAB6873226.1 hypothetical protein [Escherichia coli]UYE90907.1 hypothetical protein SP13_088 [Escherichia phage vB_EcoM_SP13]WAQ79435.1 hypothetical protein F13_0004 [Escherichia phage F13]EEW3693011.1 hypothetical protein [Escherichia coli]EEW5863285.1 hypothetical protein [Escherichia coli]